MNERPDMAAVTPRPWRRDDPPIIEWRPNSGPFADQGGGIEAGPDEYPGTVTVVQGGAQDEQGGAVGILTEADADFIVYAANNIEPLTAERALLGVRLDYVLLERDALAKALRTMLAEFVPADSEAEDVLKARATLDRTEPQP